MENKYPSLTLPPDQVFALLETRFPANNDAINAPDHLRVSQYYTDPRTGQLSLLFSQKIGDCPTCVWRIERNSSPSNGPVYTLSVRAIKIENNGMARGKKSFLQDTTSSPDPLGSEVVHLLTSMELRAKQALRELYPDL